jgi:hypothetical protein
MIDLIEKLYLESLKLPFCSATTYYRLINQTTPEKFGVSCCEQVEKLKNKLSDYCFDFHYLVDEIRNQHHTLVLDLNGDEVLIDPYLMQTSPIVLPNNRYFEITSPSFPKSEEVELNIASNGRKIFVKRQINQNNKSQLAEESFRFDRTKKKTTDPSYEELKEEILKYPCLPLIRVLNEEYEATQLAYFGKRNQFKSLSRFGINKEGTKEFYEDLEVICSQINSRPEELKDFLRGSYFVYAGLMSKKAA